MSVQIGVALQHMPGELYNGLPAAGRDVNSPNNLDMVLRDALWCDEPARIGSRAILQAMLNVGEHHQLTKQKVNDMINQSNGIGSYSSHHHPFRFSIG